MTNPVRTLVVAALLAASVTVDTPVRAQVVTPSQPNRVDFRFLPPGPAPRSSPFYVAAEKPPAPAPTATQKKSHGGRGALIGLAIGAGAAVLLWTSSGCKNGSDSAEYMGKNCVLPTYALIGGGTVLGYLIGRFN